MLQMSIGLSALQTAQQGLAVAGNNLANASTPGYHRQVAQLATLNSVQIGSQSYGSGVQVSDVARIVDQQLDSSVNLQTSANNYTDTSLTSSTQIQTAISPGLTSPSGTLESLLNSLQALSNTPTSGTAMSAAVTSAQTVAQAFNSTAQQLSQIQSNLDQSITGSVNQINQISQQIANLNGQIATSSALGATSNSLLDKQSQLISQLSSFINVQTQVGQNGQTTVIGGGVALVAGSMSTAIAASKDSTGVSVKAVGSDASMVISSGTLGAQLTERNQTVPQFQERLDAMARQVAASFNSIQSTGLSGSGGLTNLTGKNGATSSTVPLNAAGLTFPVSSGSLFIGVTDAATGARTVTEVPIDPQSQSLQDVANAISSTVPNVSAYVNSQTNTLSIMSNTGYTFDFTGGYNSTPDTNFSVTTTSTPKFGGAISDGSNGTYNFTFTSDGTVGSTPGLQAEITDASGVIVGTANIGSNYKPGDPIALANGLTVKFSAGDVTNGDTFSTPYSGTPDSAGLLNALGINGLFTGNSASTLQVSSEISNNPSLLSTSTTGQPGDISNLQRFLTLADSPVLGNGTQSFSQYANQMVTDIGSRVQSLQTQQDTNQTLTSSLNAQQQSISGVDTNEELTKILQYQQMFAFAGKYISTVNDTMQSLIGMIN